MTLDRATREELLDELMARPGGTQMLRGTLGRMSSVRLPCPRLDTFERYADWRKAYNFWSAATGLCDRSKAAEVLACVASATKNYPGDLVSMVLDSLSWEQVGNPDVKDILEFLDKMLGEDKKHAAWRLSLIHI